MKDVIIYTDLPPERAQRVLEVFLTITRRPFPNPALITEIISKAFPDWTQAQVYQTTQVMKKSIAECELIATLQKACKTQN